MNTSTIKPIPVNTNYMSPEDAIKLVEHLPILHDSQNSEIDQIDEGMIPLSLEEKVKLNIKPALDKEHEIIVGTQDVGINIYNTGKRVLASAPDYYQAFKQIKYRTDTKHNQLLHAELQKDFTESHIITSTRIIYNSNNLNAKIIHHYNSELSIPTEKNVLIPKFDIRSSLTRVLSTQEGLEFLQKLFDTFDSAKEITGVLEYVSDTNSDNIKVWTPAQKDRNSLVYRVFGLSKDQDGFHVDCDLIDNTGCFRGVKYLK